MASATIKTLKSGITLAAYVGVCTFLMASTYAYVKTDIEQNKQRQKQQLVEELIPESMLAQQPEIVQFTIPAESRLGTQKETEAYRICSAGKTEGVIFEAATNKGYSGKIQLVIGVRENGRLMGVRVIEHKETPAVGDYIAEKPSEKAPVWLDQFVNRRLTEKNDWRWAVTKDGGSFNYVAGATISPRAVVGAVKQALSYVNSEKAALFDGADGCSAVFKPGTAE